MKCFAPGDTRKSGVKWDRRTPLALGYPSVHLFLFTMQIKLSALFILSLVSVALASDSSDGSQDVTERQEHAEGKWIPNYIGQMLKRDEDAEPKTEGKWIPNYIGQVEKRNVMQPQGKMIVKRQRPDQFEKRQMDEGTGIPPHIGQVLGEFDKRQMDEGTGIPPHIGQVLGEFDKRQVDEGTGIPPYIGQVLAAGN